MDKETNDILKKLEPVLGDKKAKGLWYLNLFSKNGKAKSDNKTILRLLADRKAKQNYLKNIRLPPPSHDKLRGEYNIGKVIYPDEEFAEFGLREDEWIKHILVCGMTGTGKTNFTFNLLKQLRSKGKPFLIFDWKRSYRKLKNLPEFKDLVVIRLGTPECDFKFNPLIPPPGINPKNHMAFLVDVIKHAFFVAQGVEYLLRESIDYLFKQYGIYQGKTSYPTFKDVEELLNKRYVRGRELLWMSTTKRTLSSLTFSGLLGEVINIKEHESIDWILEKNVVFEMDNISDLEKTFFIEALMLWIYEYRKNEGKREEFKHAIIIEEAHHVLNKRKETVSGVETIMETSIRQIREFGESVIVIDQEPSKLSDSILANTNCKVCFTLGNGKDISNISKAMSLTTQEKDMIDMLKTGHAIVKLKGRIEVPIHVKIPHVNIKKGIRLDHDRELNLRLGID